MKFLIFLALVFLSISLQARTFSLEEAEELANTSELSFSLSELISNGDTLDTVNDWLEQSADAKDQEGMKLLLSDILDPIFDEKIQIIQFLIAKGVHAHFRDVFFKSTPLYRVAYIDKPNQYKPKQNKRRVQVILKDDAEFGVFFTFYFDF